MTLRRPTFRQLEAVTAVLETGSVTRAAERLHISQPAISRLIASLEADVGYAMFRRAGGRVIATAEAEMLRAEIQKALAAVDHACERVLHAGALADGHLRVCAFPSLAATTLPQLLSRFRGEHPNVSITLDGVSNVQLMIQALRTQDVDFALSGVAARADGVLAEHLCRYPAVCVVRPDHVFASAARVSLASIARETFISLGKDDESQAAISHAFREQHIEIRCPVEVSLCSSACAWVATAGGCSIVDPFTAGEWSGRLLRVETEPVIWFDIWLLRSETKPFTRVASLFLDSLRAHLISMPRTARFG